MLPNYLLILHTLSHLVIMLAHQVLSRDSFASLGNTGQCLETVLVVTALGLLLAPSEGGGVMDTTRHLLMHKTVPHRKQWSCSECPQNQGKKQTHDVVPALWMKKEALKSSTSCPGSSKFRRGGAGILIQRTCFYLVIATLGNGTQCLTHGKFWFSGPGPPGISLTGSQVMQI